MQTLEGQVAIVTGAGRNIGRGVALALASAGADVAVLDMDGENAEAAAALTRERGRRAIGIACDVTDDHARRAAVERTVAELGGVDILVNNAQQTRPFVPFTETTEDDMRQSWASGPLAAFHFMQLCHPHLVARGGGCIVNMGSGASTAGTAGFTAYGSAKEALRGLTKVAATEWGADGIRVNTLLPVAQEGGVTPPRLEGRQNTRALERMGHPEHDIGATVVFLATGGSYITGRTLMVDGGSSYYR